MMSGPIPSGYPFRSQNEFCLNMLPVAMSAADRALNRVFSPIPQSIEALESMLDKKITYIQQIYCVAEMKERRYMILTGSLCLVGMVSLVMANTLLVTAFGCFFVSIAAITLTAADHHRSIIKRNPPEDIIKSHSSIVDLIKNFEIPIEKKTAIDEKITQLKLITPSAWK